MPENPTYEELKARVGELEAAKVECQKTDAALRESRDRYRTLFEAANDAIFVASAEDGVLLDANEMAERLIGRSKEEIIGMHQSELHPAVQKESARSAFRDEALNQKGGTYIHFNVQHKNGDSIPVEISQSMIEFQGKTCVLGIFRDVTEKRERMESLQRYEAVIKAVTDPVSYVDRDYKYRIVNDAYPRYFRKPKEEIIGRPIWEMMGKDQFENAIRPRLDRCFAGEAVGYEEWFSFADGTRRYHEVRYYPVFDDDGKEVIGASAFSRDHTAQKEAEQALKESEERFRLIFEQAAAGIATATPDGKIIEANRALCDMLGYTREELCRLSVRDITHPEDWEREPALIQELVVGRHDFMNIEKRYLHKDGRTIWASLSANSLRVESRNIRYGIGVVVDITQRKQAEQALKISEARYRAIFDQAAVGITVASPDGHILENNDTMCAMLGYSPKELTGLTISDINWPEDMERQQSLIQEVLDGKRDKFQLDKRYIRKDGQPVWVHHSSNAVRKENGAIEYAIGASTDITKRKRAEAALQKSLAEKEVLLREIHHRVKNNMQAISGLLRMHARRTDDCHLTEIFDDCRGRIGAMSLIHEALYQSDNLARIDFNAYLKKLCRNLANAHDATRRGVTLTASAADVSLDMDQGVAVGMIVAELISNAFKHAFPDGEGGTVSVHLDRPDEDTIQLIVSDTGKGLPADFDIRNPPSLGMRLVTGAVTRELGGSIEATSDGGATFIIRFKCEESTTKELVTGENHV